MINDIKRRLEAGEVVELECIERSLFLSVNDGAVFDENLEILESGLVVDRVSASTISLLDCPHPIMIDEIQYFKIKENKKTFYDLVDVAVQAVRDGVIFSTEIFEDAVYICLDRSEYNTRNPSIGVVDGLEVDMKAIPDIISKINALYTETFVIEDEDDIRKVMRGAVINLQNGNELVAESGCKRHYVNYIQTTYGNMNFNLGFVSLKGATVIQKKTNN